MAKLKGIALCSHGICLQKQILDIFLRRFSIVRDRKTTVIVSLYSIDSGEGKHFLFGARAENT